MPARSMYFQSVFHVEALCNLFEVSWSIVRCAPSCIDLAVAMESNHVARLGDRPLLLAHVEVSRWAITTQDRPRPTV